ncbi:hypothetical protein SAMN02910456_01434 [Ruminococcaceae bacterium YRB3002]|nr:hypothetical protein SAMN02910456_01434 [Ruminococcaceae bacterium YRB3002]
MTLLNPINFIDFYRQFYFENDIDDDTMHSFGVPSGLNTTNAKAEEWIEEHRINKGVFDMFALAWKAGRIDWDDGHIVYKDFVDGSNCKNGLGYKIDIRSFNEYCEFLNRIDVDSYDFKSLYEMLWPQSPVNIGPVYIIASLFFRSKGRFPIYDQFVHKAVRSLALGIAPADVYMGTPPDKKYVGDVVCMYNEYITLLVRAFPDHINRSGGPFIPRELDQALWIYGHCTRRWDEIKQ